MMGDDSNSAAWNAMEYGARSRKGDRMTAQHTDGPWQIQQYTNYVGYSIYAAGRGCIAERWYDAEQRLPYGDEIGANARLIAAAPAMYEFVRRVAWEPIGHAEASAEEILDTIAAEAKAILATIAKATTPETTDNQ